jgi:hypothetical protein
VTTVGLSPWTSDLARRSRARLRVGRDTRTAFVFLAPFLAFYVLLKLYPIAYGFWISLHRWETIGTNVTFLGLGNYERIVQDRLFWEALSHTGFFTALATPALIGSARPRDDPQPLAVRRRLPGRVLSPERPPPRSSACCSWRFWRAMNGA